VTKRLQAARAVVLVLVVAATVFGPAGPPAALADTDASWPSVQGGGAHLGVVASGVPAPPLRVAWSVTPGDGGPGLSSAAVGAGVAVAVGRASVIGVDPASGRILWSVERDSGYLDPPAIGQAASGTPVAVFAQGRLGSESSLVAIDMTTRQEVWRYPTDGSLRSPLRGAPAIADGVAFVGGHDGFVYAVDLTDGELRWKFDAGGQVAAPLAVDGGRVFAVGQDLQAARTTLFALDAVTGKQVWSTGSSSLAPIVTSPTVAGGVLYVGAGSGTVRAFDAASGRVIWSTTIRGVFLTQPSLARTGDALYVMAATGVVYRLDPSTGHRVWDYQFRPTSIRGAPVVVGDYIIQGLDDGVLAAIDVRTGNLAWTTQLRDRTFGPLAAIGDVLIASTVGTDGGHGGLVGLRHVAGPLTAIESPTKLHLGAALINAALGGAAVFVGFLALFRAILRRRLTPAPVSRRDPDAGRADQQRSADRDGWTDD
jgi:outer membrane protein assembly factor BamB